MDANAAKESIKNELENYLSNKGINTRKPFRCLNPAHEDVHPSMSFDRKRKRAHCFSCGADYDTFDVVGIDYDLPGPVAAFKKAFDLFGVPLVATKTDKTPKPRQIRPKQALSLPESEPKTDQMPKTAEISQKIDYTDYFQETQKHIGETDYLALRGIGSETAARFGIGFDSRFQAGGAEWRAVIIPTGKNSFTARNTDPAADKRDRIRKHGASPIYNLAALDSPEPVFIVEGEFDALSIAEAGGNAVALGSTANCSKLLDSIKRGNIPSQPLLICMDNDAAGQDASQKLVNGLKTLGARAYVVDIAPGFKDVNEALTARREAFVENVSKARRIEEEQKNAAAEEYRRTSAGASIGEFMNGVAASVNTPFIKTGFEKLDYVLDGGLCEGLYIIGAISSLGKTTLVSQMCDQIAASGRDTLIFSLEMAKTEIMAKSISRLTLLECMNNGISSQNAKTMRGITAGKRYDGYSPAEMKIIVAAIEAYGRFADNVYINEGMGDIGAAQIRETVRRHIAITGNAPVVTIDYLQILAPHNERATDKQNTDKAVMELKRISRDFKIPVIGISSFNRQNYREAVTMEAFKESGAIEYSSDVLIGLQLKGAGGKDFDANTEKAKNPREIELKILKNRNGITGVSIPFLYYPMFNYFKEA